MLDATDLITSLGLHTYVDKKVHVRSAQRR